MLVAKRDPIVIDDDADAVPPVTLKNPVEPEKSPPVPPYCEPIAVPFHVPEMTVPSAELLETVSPVPAPCARMPPVETTRPAVDLSPAASKPPREVEVDLLVIRKRFVVVVPNVTNPEIVDVELAPLTVTNPLKVEVAVAEVTLKVPAVVILSPIVVAPKAIVAMRKERPSAASGNKKRRPSSAKAGFMAS